MGLTSGIFRHRMGCTINVMRSIPSTEWPQNGARASFFLFEVSAGQRRSPTQCNIAECAPAAPPVNLSPLARFSPAASHSDSQPTNLNADAPLRVETSRSTVGASPASAAEHQREGRPLPTVRDFIRHLAALGGFPMRNGDGEPGWITLWRGTQKLTTALQTQAAIRRNCGA